MKFDYTRKNDIDYVLTYAIELNPTVSRQRIASIYGANPGLITTIPEMVTFLKKRVADGLEIMTAFEGITVDPQSIHANDFTDQVRPFNASPGAKEFAETFTGQLLLGLFGGGSSQPPVTYQPPVMETEQNTFWIMMIAGVLIAITIIAVAVIARK